MYRLPSSSNWQTTSFSYTATDKIFRVTDASGFVTATGYDVDDRAQQTIQWLDTGLTQSRITFTAFDPMGRAAKIYKGYGSPDQITYATYQYTPNGQVAKTWDANNNLTSSTYDGFDRLSQLTLLTAMPPSVDF